MIIGYDKNGKTIIEMNAEMSEKDKFIKFNFDLLNELWIKKALNQILVSKLLSEQINSDLFFLGRYDYS